MPPTILHKNPSHLDSMVIGQGHNLMAGYIPPQVGARAFNDNYYAWANPTPETVAKFGLFSSDIDYNTYYPDLNPEDLKPKDDEFIEPMFRLLSATIVSKNYNPTDFGKRGVLKSSMNLLLGQTVNCDHETNIGNAIGSVSQVMWQEAYQDEKTGLIIPAGINGVLKIDGKANPRIARGILMEPPSIHSNSVTIQFRWDQSHPKMERNDFFCKLGTYDEKGEMIRRIVTEVVCYRETSLVSHGADTFAQKIGEDGKIINPTYANRVWNSYEEFQKDEKRIYAFDDFKSHEGNDTPDPNNEDNDTTENTDKTNNTMDPEMAAFLESLFGEGLLNLSEGVTATQELALSQIREMVASKASLQEQVTNLTTDRDTLQSSVTELNDKVTNLTARAEIGTNYLASLREEAVGTYKKLKGDSADEVVVNMLTAETTSINTLQALMKDYNAQLEEKFPMTCKKCGSHDINRASSIENNHDTQENGDTELKPASTSAVADRIYKSKFRRVQD